MAATGNRGSGGIEHHPGLQSKTTSQGGKESRSSQSNEGTIGGMASAVKEKAQDLASSVTSKASDAWDSTREMGSAVTETAENAWEQTTDFMRRYPIATMCVGIGLGFLFARVIENMASGSFGQGMRGFYPNYSGGQFETSSGRQNYQS
ncbi:MAG: hypothetical protein ACJ8FY_21905 [Gemmataceae bacterium]